MMELLPTTTIMNDEAREKPKPKIPPDLAKRLAAEDWGEISAKLTNYAHKRMRRRSMERAEEIAQEAIVRLYDGEYQQWDPAKEPSLFLFLTSIVNSFVWADGIKAASQNEKRVTSTKMERRVEREASSAPNPEEEIIARDLQQRAWAAVRAGVANDRVANKLADLVEDGVDAPAMQAEALSVDIVEVRNARRRLVDRIESVTRELAEAS
jgi:DNA-directed RNA polymerase specialized sigma24 family protein